MNWVGSERRIVVSKLAHPIVDMSSMASEHMAGSTFIDTTVGINAPGSNHASLNSDEFQIAPNEKLPEVPSNCAAGTPVMNVDAQTVPKSKGGFCSTFVGWSAKQKSLLVFLAIAECFGFASLSVVAPLFPPIAEDRGLQTAVVGLTFSALSIVAFLTAPVFGVLVPKWGVRSLIVIGLVGSGVCTAGFGIMEEVSNLGAFAAGCLLLRTIQGFFFASYITAAFAVVTTLYHSQMGVVLSFLEIVIGIGLSVGPPIGSGLYTAAGYKLPYFVLGAIMFGVAVPLFMVLPPRSEFIQLSKTSDNDDDDFSAEKGEKNEGVVFKPVKDLFLTWEPMLVLITITTVSTAFVYFHPILQPFLEEEYGSTESEAGYIFLASLGSYCLTTPISGVLSDSYPKYKFHQISFGLILATIGFLIVGPAPFLGSFLPQDLKTTIAGLVLNGLGLSFAVIPTFQGFTDATLRAGYPPNVRTFGLTSALWNAAWSLGQAIGPTLGSGVAQAAGFKASFLAVAGATAVLGALLIAHIWVNERTSSKKS